MEITRRTVLGAGAALPLVAAQGASAGPSPGDWADLSAALRGSVSLPGTSAYRSRAPLFDPHWDFRRPAAVARVLSTRDVATCVGFARDHGLRVTGRSGGHSYVGASATTGALVVDTRSLRSVDLTPGRTQTTVGAGAGLYSVHEALAAQGRSIPTGTCPTVGTAGLTLAGGLGVDSRRYGLTADRLVRATVVDGRGRIRTVDASHDADLYWALRGGGSGAALVTSFTYRTIPATSMGFFSLSFPASSAATVVRRWAEWVAEQPSDTWANAHVDTAGSSLSVRVFGVCPAGRQDSRALSLRRAIGITPTRTSTTSRAHLDAIRYLGGGSTTPRTRFVAGSDIVRVMTSGTAEAVVSAMRSAASRGLAASAILDPLDGAVRTPEATDTPFPWRGHTASVQWYVGMSSYAGSTQYSRARSWLAHAHDLMGTRSSGGYLGYLEAGRTQRELLSTNATRHARVCGTYDPDAVIL
ncbi:FAD-dependent oxidoreductase [Janibacter sp. FSL W8-0316]|uniref:FAD-binding oxidoreductase n=1 Tax=Janibacter TaxID=53457 RepID=UPI0030FA568F